MRLGIFILHYNTEVMTRELASGIEGTIVVDNGSNKAFEMEGREVLRLDRNYGFTVGWNKAIEHYFDRFDAFWLMNSDILISKEAIARIRAVAATEIGIITPAFNCWMWHCRNLLSYQYQYYGNGLRSVPVVEFTAPVIHKAVFEKVGLFSKEFPRGWGVDFDFCYRTMKAGFRIVVDDLSNFYHIGQQTIEMTEGKSSYNQKANSEWILGMNILWGSNWQKNLFGDKDFIKNIKN